jgi:predicted porin
MSIRNLSAVTLGIGGCKGRAAGSAPMKITLCLSALLTFNASHAADVAGTFEAPVIDTFKAPKLPDTLTWNGITVFGQIDVGYGYASMGAPVGNSYWGLNPQAYGTPVGTRSVSTLNTLGLSGVGVKIEEDIGNNWYVVGKLQTGFDPLTGQLDDMCATRVANNGLPASQQTTNGNGTRCGQVFNGDAWGGVKNVNYGSLTFGRQLSLGGEVDGQYDPQPIWSFSLLTFAGGGMPAYSFRWDNSAKYSYSNDIFHASVMIAEGAQDSALHGFSYSGNAGVYWNGFGADVLYMNFRDSLASSEYGVGQCGVTGTPSCSTLKVSTFNDELWGVMGKYTYDFGSRGIGGKLTFFVGYQHARYSDPSDAFSVGDTTAGGYVLGLVNNTTYLFGDQNIINKWVGAKYENGPWTVAAAYYQYNQEFYKTSATSAPCSTNIGFNCAGTIKVASISATYSVNKHLDLYGGWIWSDLGGGNATGSPVTNDNVLLTGLIVRF